ncbi:hypothetical protein GCM10009619_33590 [Williamsia maris]
MSRATTFQVPVGVRSTGLSIPVVTADADTVRLPSQVHMRCSEMLTVTNRVPVLLAHAVASAAAVAALLLGASVVGAGAFEVTAAATAGPEDGSDPVNSPVTRIAVTTTATGTMRIAHQ